MGDVVIAAERIGKRYRLGAATQPYNTLRNSVSNLASAPFRKSARKQTLSEKSEVWALKDLSLEVQRGEVLGVIGRNGAGKSTLLKILSEITEPSEGRIRVQGRVASLLEVGTGFHPELTGKENVYLNGAILGMRREEIAEKFDNIISFAEVERFIDTPVKHYSSGMYLRLAFAVAAHLDPDILLVDEVLAVGDAEFQRRCAGRMSEVARSGRTVMLVSHNMAAISGLCSRAVLLGSGRVLADGSPNQVIDVYMRSIGTHAGSSLAERADRRGNGALRFLNFEMLGEDGAVTPVARSGGAVTLAFAYRCPDGCIPNEVEVTVGLHGQLDENLFLLSTAVTASTFYRPAASGTLECSITVLPLLPGEYPFTLFCMVDGEIADWIEHAGVISVEAGDFFGSGQLPPTNQGPFLVDQCWGVRSEREGQTHESSMR